METRWNTIIDIKRTISKNINVSFINHLFLSKYSFFFNIYRKQFIDGNVNAERLIDVKKAGIDR